MKELKEFIEEIEGKAGEIPRDVFIRGLAALGKALKEVSDLVDERSRHVKFYVAIHGLNGR